MDNYYQYQSGGQHLEGFGSTFDGNPSRNFDDQTSSIDHSSRQGDIRDYSGRRGDLDFSDSSPKSGYRDLGDVDSSLHISVSDLNIRDFPGRWDSNVDYSGQYQRRSGSNGSGASSPHSTSSREHDRHHTLDNLALPIEGLESHRHGNIRPIGSRSLEFYPDGQSYGHHNSPVGFDDHDSGSQHGGSDDYGYRSGGSLGSGGSSFGSGRSGVYSERAGGNVSYTRSNSASNVDPQYETSRYRYGMNVGDINPDYLGYMPRSDVDSIYQQHAHSSHQYTTAQSRSVQRAPVQPRPQYHPNTGSGHIGVMPARHVSDYSPPPLTDQAYYHRQAMQQHTHVQRSNSLSPLLSGNGGGNGVPVYRQQRHGNQPFGQQHVVGNPRPHVSHNRPINQPDPRYFNSSNGPSYGQVGQSTNAYAPNRSAASFGRNAPIDRRDIELEEAIYRNAQAILSETANRCLKSVELANALRDRIGKDALLRTKTLYGGLLVLLELYKETFIVHRIPKNDMVELIVPSSHGPGGPGGGFVDTGGSRSTSSSTKSASISTDVSQSTLSQPLMEQAVASNCVFISEIPDNVGGTQIWNDFGGQDIVQKVSIEFQGSKKTGMVVFTSVNAARAALKSPALSAWKHLLSFSESNASSIHNGSDETVGRMENGMGISRRDGYDESNSATSDSDALARMLVPSGGRSDVEDFHMSRLDTWNATRAASTTSSITSASNDDLFDDETNDDRKKSPRDFADIPSPLLLAPPGLEYDMSSNGRPPVAYRRVAPPPINTTAEIITSENAPTSADTMNTALPSPAFSTPGGTPRLSFSFFDESAEGGMTTLSGDTLPQNVCDVMNTLCDMLYVPQRKWDRNEVGDYLFCQILTEILSTQFGGNFIQMTKLKQQLKRKFGGTIRIVPLKALIVAYPEYFEVDRNVNVVRCLQTTLPPMNISVITNA